MKPILEYIDEAYKFLEIIWGDFKSSDIRAYLKKNLSHWTAEEQEEFLILCATLARFYSDGAQRVISYKHQQEEEFARAANNTHFGVAKFVSRAKSHRQDEARKALLEKIFGDILGKSKSSR